MRKFLLVQTFIVEVSMLKFRAPRSLLTKLEPQFLYERVLMEKGVYSALE